MKFGMYLYNALLRKVPIGRDWLWCKLIMPAGKTKALPLPFAYSGFYWGLQRATSFIYILWMHSWLSPVRPMLIIWKTAWWIFSLFLLIRGMQK